jgi:hypothetical protein
MKIKIFILASIVTISLFINSVYAINYVLWYSAVDNWEIRWGWSTTYSSQLTSAISTWNNYWDINIAPDNASTYEDLTIVDINDSNESRYWYYDYDIIWADELELNIAHMSLLTSNQRQNVITHELWHALWLAHSIPNNIMVAIWELDRISLWDQDKADYDYLRD